MVELDKLQAMAKRGEWDQIVTVVVSEQGKPSERQLRPVLATALLVDAFSAATDPNEPPPLGNFYIDTIRLAAFEVLLNDKIPLPEQLHILHLT
ncbi:hypothetical protein A2160_05520 [Candidatus Beckwithbacteria bacterium RBG_13_42_9]|uniref:Uncharacterized protein n=1 Tax=Candidatus Beckwithbacteria bacterium RBG_13_42_9 TaxID=1797457 RepID=A0A1F5E5W1_9BACT|nr:MAG: hypothetical protein A2160_05520 [Candidatus Beckwithbacteria bacterium RBG_13_42_9]